MGENLTEKATPDDSLRNCLHQWKEHPKEKSSADNLVAAIRSRLDKMQDVTLTVRINKADEFSDYWLRQVGGELTSEEKEKTKDGQIIIYHIFNLILPSHQSPKVIEIPPEATGYGYIRFDISKAQNKEGYHPDQFSFLLFTPSEILDIA